MVTFAPSANYDPAPQAIGRYDFPTMMEVTAPINLGVVADSITGIFQVDFYQIMPSGSAIEKVLIGSTTKPALNSDTGIVEYFVTFDPAKIADGPVTIQAVIWPRFGLSRVLDPIIVNANAKGSLPTRNYYLSTLGSDSNDGSLIAPMRSIAAAVRSAIKKYSSLDGVVLNLPPGEFVCDMIGADGKNPFPGPSTKTRYMVIKGAGPTTVLAKSKGGFNSFNLKIESCTVRSTIQGNSASRFWFDKVDFIGPGLTDITGCPSGGTRNQVWTRCTVKDCYKGFSGGQLLRSCTVINNSSDAIDGLDATIDVDVLSLVPFGGTHPDVFQHVSVMNNMIVYGLRAINCVAQGIPIGANSRDVAYIDVDIDNSTCVMTNFQAGGPSTHVVLRRCTFKGGCHFNLPFSPTNWLIEQSTTIPSSEKFPGIQVRN